MFVFNISKQTCKYTFYHLGPQRAPEILSESSNSPDSIFVSWKSIPRVYQGANFKGYRVKYNLASGADFASEMVNASQLQISISGLMGFKTYEIEVCGYGEDIGPCTKTTVRTKEGGNFYFFLTVDPQ